MTAGAPTQQDPISRVIACCVLLGVAEYALYHVNFRQYFQGDAVFWMYYRFRSVGEFLRGFATLDVAHWYRPLSNRTIPSLLYPLLGMRPYGYHLVFFACFFVTTCAVFLFFRSLTGKISTAFLGAFYFSIHSINIYTTYDFAFSPEVFYVFFYVGAVWFFVLGERRDSAAWRAASVACCVLTLMSKEAAVTFPAMLLLTHLYFIGGGFVRALRAIAVHVGVWIAYLVYVVWYLGVGGGDYMLVVHTNVINNLVTGIFYALNLHRDGWMPARAPQPVFLFFVIFALGVLAVGSRLLFRPERRLIAFGALWFVIGLAPMLMLNGLGPYYVFLALVGVALIVGASLNHIYERAAAWSRLAARGAMGAVLILLWMSCRSVLAADTAGDIALGYASQWARNSAADMLQARPQLRPGTKIYILNDPVSDLWRFHGIGNLFKLVYQDDSITTAYRSLGQGPGTQNGELIVMKVEGERLVDVTEAFKAEPAKYLDGGIDASQFTYVEPPGVRLRVDPTEVVAGRDFYWLIAEGLGSADLVVQYTLDDGPVAEARFRLNPEGRIRFFLTNFTPVGVFHFIRFRALASPASEWIRADARLRVLPPL